MPKVSVIVPIYNVEKYLEKCMNSIITQTLSDIEIILVNDGSCDTSLTICQEYEQKDSRILIINKPNGGVSSARNAGLKAATGDYVGFVDPDDYIDSRMYELLYSTAVMNHSDICRASDYFTENAKGRTRVTDFYAMSSKEEYICRLIAPNKFSMNNDNIMGSVCTSIFRRGLVNESHITFKENLVLAEDLIFTLYSVMASATISVCNGCFYYYVEHQGSAVHKYNKDMEIIYRELDKELYQFIRKYRLDKMLEARLNVLKIGRAISLIINECKAKYPSNIFIKSKKIHNYSCNHKLRMAISRTDTREIPYNKRLVLFCLKYNLSLLLLIYYSFALRCHK